MIIQENNLNSHFKHGPLISMAKGICKNVREMKYEVGHSSLEIANNQINHTHSKPEERKRISK